MDAKLKEKWVKALRSGEYKQGKGRLYREGENTYCCLGVLCVAADIPITDNGKHAGPDDDGDYSPLRNLMGPEHRTGTFTGMNDVDEKTFPEIADYIEEHL